MIKNGSLVRVKDYKNIKDHFDFVDGMEIMCGHYLIVKGEESWQNGEACCWYEDYWFYESMLDEVDLNVLSEYIIKNIDEIRKAILDN